MATSVLLFRDAFLFLFLFEQKKKGKGALKEGVFADIIWMLLTLRHGDSVTEMS